jgi:hypothetical protein
LEQGIEFKKELDNDFMSIKSSIGQVYAMANAGKMKPADAEQQIRELSQFFVDNVKKK